MRKIVLIILTSCVLYSCDGEFNAGAAIDSELECTMKFYRQSNVEEIDISEGLTIINGFEYSKGADASAVMANRFKGDDSVVIATDNLKISYINPIHDSSANFNKTKGSHIMDADAWSFNGDDAIYEIKESDFEKFGVSK